MEEKIEITMKKRKSTWFVASAFILAAATEQSHAGLINGGFESGDFTGWNTIGMTDIETAAFGSEPTEGINQAFMMTSRSRYTVGPVDRATIESFLGLSSGAMDVLSDISIRGGSAISQTIVGNVGDVLSFDWNFLTNEDPGYSHSGYPDLAFWTLTTVQSSAVLARASTYVPFLSSPSAYGYETGFKSFSYTLPSTGTFLLGFGAVNAGDNVESSALLIDNVSVRSAATVPAPATLALLGFGLATLAWVGRRKFQMSNRSPVFVRLTPSKNN